MHLCYAQEGKLVDVAKWPLHYLDSLHHLIGRHMDCFLLEFLLVPSRYVCHFGYLMTQALQCANLSVAARRTYIHLEQLKVPGRTFGQLGIDKLSSPIISC